jgi:hypothetical protein
LGLIAGWVLAGVRYRLIIFSLLCLPAVIGESASASAFGATVGPLIERVAPLNGTISFALFEAWRMTGPAAIVSTLIIEHLNRTTVLETLPFTHRLLAGWRRWRVFTGACIFAGITIALVGSGHIQVEGLGYEAAKLVGPAEPGWRNPNLQAVATWAALTWPLFIIMNAVFLGLALRLPGRLTGGGKV